MDAEETIEISYRAAERYKGHVGKLEQAIGLLILGQKVGWKVLYLMHDKRTIHRAEKLLGVDLREVLPEVGPMAKRSVAWSVGRKVSNFWKAVKGEIKGVRSPDLR